VVGESKKDCVRKIAIGQADFTAVSNFIEKTVYNVAKYFNINNRTVGRYLYKNILYNDLWIMP